MSPELSSIVWTQFSDVQQKLIAVAMSIFRDRETNFRLVIYSRSSTSPGPIDVEMVGLTEIVNNIK